MIPRLGFYQDLSGSFGLLLLQRILTFGDTLDFMLLYLYALVARKLYLYLEYVGGQRGIISN